MTKLDGRDYELPFRVSHAPRYHNRRRGMRVESEGRHADGMVTVMRRDEGRNFWRTKRVLADERKWID